MCRRRAGPARGGRGSERQGPRWADGVSLGQSGRLDRDHGCVEEGRGEVIRSPSLCPSRTWRIQGEDDLLPIVVAFRSCTVSYQDLDGITHSVDVTAETLYEAAVIG